MACFRDRERHSASTIRRDHLVFKQLSPLLIVVAFVSMLLLSMGKWPDPFIDFGRELYVPWAMLQGKQLYVDIFYFNGPLSPYFNCLVFKLIGVGSNSLVIVNTSLLCLIVFLLFSQLRMASSHWLAICGCTVFILLFSCSQYTTVGNYNYITPYSHEATHGMLLSLAMLVCLGRSMLKQRDIAVAGAGLMLGLTFLTKPEFFLASLLTMTGFLFMTGILYGWRKSVSSGMLAVFTAALPVSVAFLLLSSAIPPGLALKGILGGWLYGESLVIEFYQLIMGVLDFQLSLYTLALCTLGYVILFGVPVLACWLKLNRTVSYGVAILIVLSLWLIVYIYSPLPLLRQFARPLPVFVLTLGVWSFYVATRNKSSKSAYVFVFSIFSALLLGKMFMNARIFHYGFVLAMPAFMLSGLLFFDWIPRTLRRLNRESGPYLIVIAGFLVSIIGLHLNVTRDIYSRKPIPVTSNGDLFYSDSLGNYLNEAVRWIHENTADTATVCVLPEGPIINYLCRRLSPVPVVNFMPPEMFMFGEENALRTLTDAPPDYIVLVHKDTSEYGYQFFGKDYGVDIYNWIVTNYVPRTLVGAMPLRDNRFGILIAERKDI